MKIEELVHKNLEMSIYLDCFCNVQNCNNPVQTILILDCEEWQLCGPCYYAYLSAVRDLPKRDAAEHCVEPSKTGPSVTGDATSEKDGAVCTCFKNYLGTIISPANNCPVHSPHQSVL
jgi:hypothetical protein